jgi:hypothetical protein
MGVEGPMPYFSRIFFGITICPFDVTFDEGGCILLPRQKLI